MTLADQYQNQLRWRQWPKVADSLPALSGSTVLDLGCAVGDVASLLASRGCNVIGFDRDESLLEVARSKGIPGADFRQADLHAIPAPGVVADGIWCSFTAAYLPCLTEQLLHWGTLLKPGGWIALIEIDDLFGHEPIDRDARTILRAYADEALAAGRYDFLMGRKLRGHLEAAGFVDTTTSTLHDEELSFRGPASSDVLDAWRARLQRLTTLRGFCGADFDHVQTQLMDALAHPQHRSTAVVYACVAKR